MKVNTKVIIVDLYDGLKMTGQGDTAWGVADVL